MNHPVYNDEIKSYDLHTTCNTWSITLTIVIDQVFQTWYNPSNATRRQKIDE